VFSNREAQRLLGDSLPRRISLASANPVESAIARAVAGHATQRDEAACGCPCPTATFSIHAAPIRRPDGEILAAVCAFQDVSERQKEQSLLRKQAQMINLSHDAIITATAHHVITGWNTGAEEMYGWTAAEAVGHKSYKLIGTGASVAEIHATLAREGRWDGELLHHRRDGTEILVESRQMLVPASDGEPAAVLKINRDITARKRAVEALRESEAWRKFTQQAAGIGIIDWDLRNNRAKCSEEFCALYGIEASALEPAMAGWLRLIHPDDREGVERRVETALREREPFDVEFRVMRPNGTMGWLAAKVAVFFDGEGRPERAIAAQMDVTARKSAEEAHYAAQKLESVGLLAGGVAHDFNNLLTTVLGHASLLLPQASPVQRESLEAIIAGSERAAELTRQLLAYAGKARFHIREADLSALVRGMTDLVRLSIPKSIELKLDLAENLPAIKVDTGQFQQVIMNLVMNAAEAIGEGRTGTVSIAAARRAVDGQLAIRPGEELEPGLYCCLEVSDTGCGMDAGTMERVFEPFFSTKFLGRGLGMAAVAGIVRSHRGAIAVRSTPGWGSTFTVFFPAEGEPARVEVQEAPAEDLRGDGTVLVVEDEEIVRRFLVSAVSQFGYGTVEAADGAQALTVLETRSDITVVLLDLVMPVMGGGDVLSEIKRLRPDLPVLVTSGYNEAEAQRLCAPHGNLQFIQKPYTAPQLAARIKAVMARSEGAG
jgi:PAS domain S-box-containing protein